MTRTKFLPKALGAWAMLAAAIASGSCGSSRALP